MNLVGPYNDEHGIYYQVPINSKGTVHILLIDECVQARRDAEIKYYGEFRRECEVQ